VSFYVDVDVSVGNSSNPYDALPKSVTGSFVTHGGSTIPPTSYPRNLDCLSFSMVVKMGLYLGTSFYGTTYSPPCTTPTGILGYTLSVNPPYE